MLENTATELLAAAEEAASRRDRGAAARQFQRAALHLEIVRLLGGKPLAPALEASRRYARWRARRLSHLLENCVLEHSPEDPRTFDAAYSLTGEILGRGGYGVVLGCTRRADQEAFACKRLDLKRLSAKGLARLHEEIAALKALDHPSCAVSSRHRRDVVAITAAARWRKHSHRLMSTQAHCETSGSLLLRYR